MYVHDANVNHESASTAPMYAIYQGTDNVYKVASVCSSKLVSNAPTLSFIKQDLIVHDVIASCLLSVGSQHCRIS